MARSTQTRSSDSPRDAIALLKQDHRTVSALFDEFEKADDEEQSAIAQRVCQLLTVHATIEEELLYPAAKQVFEDDEENEDLVNEAEVEHGSAKELIAKIEEMSSDDEHFKATVTVLGEYIKHHVKEEENELFPQLKKTDLDLKELGGRLADRKFALMEQLGIEEADEPAQPRKRSVARGARSRSNNRRSGSRARH
ncbi:MAG TPA: hemerythrin domain-containing protein [Steroidobacteraceae bacterium]|jgi:hemerythrin-like domain-containing protein|nr:hemerythrin domain-containing protein [Steroidobacteraceae bacterium]